jgi:radical SAM superfamily enzyme YgiQ (UPF0313 family)
MLAMILATKDLPGYNYFKPLGMGYLKSYLKKELPNIEMRIFEDIDSLIRAKPECVGISAATEDFSIAQRYIKRIQQELDCPILMGGVHISLLPETLPRGVVACIGEGEETLVDLMKVFKKYKKFDQNNLPRIKGIAFWDNQNKLIFTEPRELITPLDKIPLPDRDSLGIKPFLHKTLYMFTSRGCPYQCKFCVSRVHWKKYREFSSDYVIREMEELIKKYKVKNISFFDDLFIVNRKRLREIAKKFEEKRFQVQTVCAVRANLVDDELCELLKRINVKEVTFGAESFSESVLNQLKKGSVTAIQNQQALDTLKKHGITANCSIIFDAPEEKREDLITTWKAIFNNLRSGKLNKVGWGLLRPYPGCDYWDMAVKKGIVGIDMDWDNFKNWDGFHLNDNMTRQEVDTIIDEWETKCYLANLQFRDESQHPYLSKEAVIARKERLIEVICARENKDESDQFVEQNYKEFLQKVEQYEVILINGWYEDECNETWRWINRDASFYIPSKVKKVANYLNLVFYVADIHNYGDAQIQVTLKVGQNKNTLTVSNEGEYKISVEIPLLTSPFDKYLECEIISSGSFCPSSISADSEDTRELSIVINKLELAKDDLSNIVRNLKFVKSVF